MALMQPLQELPELESPLNYPECLDRIVQVAVNRANFEINQNRVSVWLIDKIENDPLECIEIMGERIRKSFFVPAKYL